MVQALLAPAPGQSQPQIILPPGLRPNPVTLTSFFAENRGKIDLGTGILSGITTAVAQNRIAKASAERLRRIALTEGSLRAIHATRLLGRQRSLLNKSGLRGPSDQILQLETASLEAVDVARAIFLPTALAAQVEGAGLQKAVATGISGTIGRIQQYQGLLEQQEQSAQLVDLLMSTIGGQLAGRRADAAATSAAAIAVRDAQRENAAAVRGLPPGPQIGEPGFFAGVSEADLGDAFGLNQ